jgi:hypothetical protein
MAAVQIYWVRMTLGLYFMQGKVIEKYAAFANF